MFRRLTAVFLALSACALPSHALRNYFIGNSFIDCLNYTGFQKAVESQGLADVWGRTMIPGAPLSWFWGHPNDGVSQSPYGIWSSAFKNYEWDAVSLNICSRTLANSDGDPAAVRDFCAYIAPRSPSVIMYLYAVWPNKSMGDYATVWNARYTGSGDTWCSASYYDTLMKVVRKENASVLRNLPRMVPAGHVLNEIQARCKAGRMPGHSSVYEFYADDGHLNQLGGYVLCCTFFAVLYQRDPRGLSVPAEYGSIGASLASAIQDAVWAVVRANPYTGVSGTGVVPTKAAMVQRPHAGRTATAAFSLDGRRCLGSRDSAVPGVRIASGDGVLRSTLIGAH